MCLPRYSSRVYPSRSSSAWFAQRICPSEPTQCNGRDAFSTKSLRSASRSSAVAKARSNSAMPSSWGSIGVLSLQKVQARLGSFIEHSEERRPSKLDGFDKAQTEKTRVTKGDRPTWTVFTSVQ